MQNWIGQTLVVLSVAAMLLGSAIPAAAGDGSLEKSASTWKRPADLDAVKADPAKLDQYRCPPPTDFAIVYSLGFGGDNIGVHGPAFAALLEKIKALGYNVIHCTYTDERLEACRKAGVKLMVEMLDDGSYHVYKNLPKNAALGAKLEGDPAVWGYNIWNAGIKAPHVLAGRQRDLRNVRLWDPSHPAYLGTYQNHNIEGLALADCPGYYDLHWAKDHELRTHFEDLSAAWKLCKAGRSCFYSWYGTGAGAAGEDNFRKNLWSANTGIAFGLKGIMWFLSDSVLDPKTFKPGPYGADIQRINAELAPYRRVLMEIGQPVAVYGTAITKDPTGKPVADGKPAPMPVAAPVPADFPAQPKAGEFVMGHFKDKQGKDVLYVASYSAVAAQDIQIQLRPEAKVSLFDAKAGQWKQAAPAGGLLALPLQAGGGQMLRLD